jgi:hypothetical protein
MAFAFDFTAVPASLSSPFSPILSLTAYGDVWSAEKMINKNLLRIPL